MTISFDHCYCNFITPENFANLSQYGFSTNVDYCIEHEGGSFCRFIKVGEHYLEFVHIPNPQQHENYEKENGYPPHSAGVSFKIDRALQEQFKIIKKEFPYLKAEYNHRNYHWKENEKDYLPGWNFLSLKSSIVKDLYFWFTEYEPSPEREKNRKLAVAEHSNTAAQITGLIVDFSNQPSKELLAQLTKGKIINDHLILEDGTQLYDINKLNLGILSKKKTALKAVMIKVDNFAKAKETCSGCQVFNFQGSPAIHIQQHESAFDLLLTKE